MHALTVDNMTFGYDRSIDVLRNVSLTVEQGEFLSLAGPNGSGKTTLLRLLDKIYVPRHGTISLDGTSLSSFTRSAIARRMAFVPQDGGMVFPFTVAEIVLMGRAPHSRGQVFESSHDHDVVRGVMELTDIGHLADKPVTALSGGERQRVFIARALAQEPAIILLDEPNAHLDIAHQVDVFRLLKKLNKETGLTVVSVSHELNLAAAFSDRIALLVDGNLVACSAPSEVLTEERIRDVFHTRVLVDIHPAGHRPRITLLT